MVKEVFISRNLKGITDREDFPLGSGAELITVRDNLRHASISTTSIYLHGDDLKRARQLSAAFLPRN